MMSSKFRLKQFIIVTFFVNIWVQVSETVRYLVFVVPHMEAEGSQLLKASGIVLVIWIVWGTLLSGLSVYSYWLHNSILGNSMRTVLIAATISWTFVFVLFWIGLSNMGLSEWNLLWITLPLSWLEIFIATLIASKLYRREMKTQRT